MKKPTIAGKSPQMELLEVGKTYAWCSCGKSSNQPWCNGLHKGTEFKPNVFKVEESKTKALCMCKNSKNPPYCDGSHTRL